MPRPKSAVASGSPAATTEPNVSSRTKRRDREADGLRGDLARLRVRDHVAAKLDAHAVAGPRAPRAR